MAIPKAGGDRARRRGTPIGRDVVLAIGLAGVVVGGLVTFVKAVGASGTRLPVVPVVLAAILLSAVALAGWSVAPARRRPAAGPGPAPWPETAVPDGSGTADLPDLPDLGATALDHAAVDADGFEHTIAALCVRDGCTPVEVVGGAGDLGADVLATTPDGLRVVLQCKHYCEDNRVGSQDLQRFGGTCFAVHDADVAVVVTTSSFTEPALEYAAACGIVCIDGDALAAWTELAAAPPWEATDPDPDPVAV
ncbi:MULTISPECIES: restriction endonuclease [Streptomyces]|uniref:restriction endonuclease n=1 Tax=Streptomyces TaxID=1883 RepID=UPI000F550486|nr:MULTISPECIES: restriction endonuclease [Streptomyces]RPK32870.1 Restriction endonuclease [Streptomyces sp. ADI91-18]WSS02632.1 restriction endonuclease [Streptomyces goshikiensis]